MLKEKDLHASIAGLVAASKPLMSLVTSASATRSGSQRIELKAVARENGKKGGRPRKPREAALPAFA